MEEGPERDPGQEGGGPGSTLNYSLPPSIIRHFLGPFYAPGTEMEVNAGCVGSREIQGPPCQGHRGHSQILLQGQGGRAGDSERGQVEVGSETKRGSH